ncbi:NUDIX domain-containing protein [Salinicoccus jeotgali]|uniref:NUDIX domain-containing protein n=2 Tax=Salinicoccus jeotgali TaxID=381634 RepID=A0ABP7EVK4_9STAP
MMSKFDEQILVVPRQQVFKDEADAFNGFISKEDPRYARILSAFNDYKVKRRGDMEEDPTYKQLISYAVITAGEETLVYKRLEGGGEDRLHGLLSIGVGGHMNDVPETGAINEKLFINAARELEEEVGLQEDALEGIEVMGLINDDEDEVGRGHIGVVFKVEVDKDKVHAREEDTLELVWKDRSLLPKMKPYESWSELIIRDAYGQ